MAEIGVIGWSACGGIASRKTLYRRFIFMTSHSQFEVRA
jgi:hypothetical protein